MCIICENAELKAEQLKKHIGSEHSLETVIENSRHDDFEAENAFKEALEKLVEGENKSVVGYLRWEKVKQTDTSKNTGRAKSDRVMRISKTETVNKLAASMLEEFETYKSHLERVSEMKREVKAMKVETEENGDLAVLHIDWAEQHKLIEMREVQSAYFNGRWHYDIHTGYWYCKEDSHGIASISDCPDHKAEAVHAAIKGEITKLVEKGKTTIVIVSDGPTSQYRNSKNVFLMKRLAVELQICIRLLFTESGHGACFNRFTTEVGLMLRPLRHADEIREFIADHFALNQEIVLIMHDFLKLSQVNWPLDANEYFRAFHVRSELIELVWLTTVLIVQPLELFPVLLVRLLEPV